jgi:hypothetical protein
MLKNLVQFDDRLWRHPEDWPHEQCGYVFLARAFGEIGSALHGQSWIHARGANNPEEPKDPECDDGNSDDDNSDDDDSDDQWYYEALNKKTSDNECDDETWERYLRELKQYKLACKQAEAEFLSMWDSVWRKIAEECGAGTLVSAVARKRAAK